MGGEDTVALANEGKRQVSNKTCYALLFLAALACVVVGLIVFYVTNMECQAELEELEKNEGGGDDVKGKPLKQKVTDVRLPTHLVPTLYKVQLVPFIIPGNYTIRGRVEVTFDCVQAANNVTLHTADMEIDHSSVTLIEKGNSKSEIEVSGNDYDQDREFYITKLNGWVKPGRSYVWTAEFVAQLTDSLKGFYRSVYKDENDREVTIATTQFQATDARRAFPCMDEPALKARFEVSLGRWTNMTSISNMPQKQTGVPMEGTSEYVWDHYEVSVPMSTYLVAFVVSDFVYKISPPTGNNIQFRLWARRNAVDQLEYASSVGAKMLKFFEDYFNVTYPLPKQDMIAIPDFSAGAMENWGLITYRETAMLFKPGISSLNTKQRIAVIISHELAHQWFGNLVTPSWWTDLWLNEGFASYVEYLGVEKTEPDMKLLEQFIITDLQPVMRLDALESSHPISIPVKHPDEISEIFDRISYGKGASIIRMMDAFLTTETFRRGLTNYLNAFKYKAAEQDDLWRHLTQQAHNDGTLSRDLTVKEIMDTWTLQMGFPVVTVKRNYKDSTASVSQERFLALQKPDQSSKGGHDYQWWVPLTFTSPGGDGSFNNTYSKYWLRPREGEKLLKGMPSKDKPVIFNVKQNAYYRVNYDKRNWELLISALSSDHTSIHVTNRAQIIDDAFNLARAGKLDYELALQVTSYLGKEVEYLPWNSALSGLGYLNTMLKRTAAYGEFKRYMKSLITPIFARVRFESQATDSHLDTFLRRYVVSWACKLELPECIEKARDVYKKWMDELNPDSEGANPVDVNLKRQIYCHAISQGGEEEWDFGWERQTESNVGSEKSALRAGLTCSKELWLLNRYLNMSLSGTSGVRKQDGRSIITNIASNIYGRDLAFDYVRNSWDRVLEFYGGSSFSLPGLVKGIMADRNTRFDVDELLRFHKDNENRLDGAERSVRQAIEQGENNIKWMEQNYQNIFDWLKKQNRMRF